MSVLMYMEEVVKIIEGNRITLPEKIRKKLKLKQGDFLILRLEGKKLEILPADIKPK